MNWQPNLEPRLQRRYGKLVEEHLSPADRLAAGLRSLPGLAAPFASTQAAYRFFQNEGVDLRDLAEPLIRAAREGVQAACGEFALVVHDWSNVHFGRHHGKKDRIALSTPHDLGYCLQSAIVLEDREGQPLAPLSLALTSAQGVHCSRVRTVRTPQSKLDEVEPVMDFARQQQFAKPAVHLVDAEGDSVFHLRDWQQHQHQFLVRTDHCRVVRHPGGQASIRALHQELLQQGSFRWCRTVLYQGKPAGQWIAEISITLERPAKPQRIADGGKRRTIAGAPLDLRLVISEVRDAQGQVLAVWYLLTNVAAVPADQIALWYYWRWRIESYFKLLKSAGQQLEHWQQESAAAVARRLLVASMACVIVWRLAREKSPQADEARQLLARLSGHQMKHTRPFTEPALLAGTWVFLAMLRTLEEYSPQDLLRLASQIVPNYKPRSHQLAKMC